MSELGFLDAVSRQAQSADDVSHRPWPLPDGSWAQAQTWEDVLFAHWPVDLEELARLLPADLPVDTHEGRAWLGIVPVRVTGLRLRGLPPVPGLSSALQLAVRTYVSLDDRPGIWLFSLDSTGPLLVEAAKRAHRLPAYRAKIAMNSAGGAVRFGAVRDGLEFTAGYEAHGPEVAAAPGTLEHFLVERYALYTSDGGRLYRADIHHRPWQLRAAEATVQAATIAPVALDGSPRLVAAARQDLLVWPLEEL